MCLYFDCENVPVKGTLKRSSINFIVLYRPKDNYVVEWFTILI